MHGIPSHALIPACVLYMYMYCTCASSYYGMLMVKHDKDVVLFASMNIIKPHLY